MKNPITTKDLGALSELMLFEKWAAVKFEMFESWVEDAELKKMFKSIYQKHQSRAQALLDYLIQNKEAGGQE